MVIVSVVVLSPHKAEVGSGKGCNSMQPDIVAENGDKPKGRVETRYQPHNGQETIEDDEPSGKADGATERTVREQTPQTYPEMHDVVQHIDREQAQETAIACIDGKVRSSRTGRLEGRRQEPKDAYDEIDDTQDEREVTHGRIVGTVNGSHADLLMRGREK
jgi:hypothetical protein